MAVNLQYYSAAVAAGAGNGVVAGLFVPLANLPGVISAELSETTKERKIVYSLINKVFSGLNALTDKLGIAPTKVEPVGVDVDTFDQSFQFQNQYMVNWATGQIDVIPLPTSNVGLITLENALSSGIAFVAAEAAISGAGVLIPNTLITGSSGSIPADANVADARDYICGLVHGLIMNLDANASVIANTKSNPAGINPSATFLALTNVTDLNHKSFFSVTYTYTQRIILNQVTQTFDIAS